MSWFTNSRGRASRSNGDHCKLSLQQLEDRTTPSAVVTAVTINSLQVGANQTQRSRVTDVAITFDSPVTFVGSPEAAFSLNRVSGGPLGSVTLVATVDNSGPGSVVTLTFVGGVVEYNSLADGRYALHVQSAQVVGGLAGGDFLYDEPASPAPLDYTKIFRLFADYNGDGAVSAYDFTQFRLAFGGNGYAFDNDNDGAVAASDFIRFRNQFGGGI